MTTTVVSVQVDSHLMHDGPMRPCIICGGPTNSIELNFEAPVHRGTCTMDLWQEWKRATFEALEAQGDAVEGVDYEW